MHTHESQGGLGFRVQGFRVQGLGSKLTQGFGAQGLDRMALAFVRHEHLHTMELICSLYKPACEHEQRTAPPIFVKPSYGSRTGSQCYHCPIRHAASRTQ